jgi:hypothetical protein
MRAPQRPPNKGRKEGRKEEIPKIQKVKDGRKERRKGGKKKRKKEGWKREREKGRKEGRMEGKKEERKESKKEGRKNLGSQHPTRVHRVVTLAKTARESASQLAVGPLATKRLSEK